MNRASLVACCAIFATLCGCGSNDQSKITKAATSCITDAYHRNSDIQAVENIQIVNFGPDKVSADDKSKGIVSVVPFDAKYSILLRTGNGAWQQEMLHLEAVRDGNGHQQIRTVAVPGDATYTTQLQRFEPWSCEVPANG